MQASLELQRFLVGHLARHEPLQALGIRVYDGPPKDAPSPYLSVGADTVFAKLWQGGVNFEHRFTVGLWNLGDSFSLVKAWLVPVERLLLGLSGEMESGRLLKVRLVRSVTRRGPRNWTHGALEMRAITVWED